MMAIAAGVLLIFGVGAPMLILFALFKNMYRLADPKFYTSFGFIYKGYSVRRQLFWWYVAALAPLEVLKMRCYAEWALPFWHCLSTMTAGNP